MGGGMREDIHFFFPEENTEAEKALLEHLAGSPVAKELV